MKKFLFFLFLLTLKNIHAQNTYSETVLNDKMGTHYLKDNNQFIRLNLQSIQVFDLDKLHLIKEISLTPLPKDWIPIKLIKFQNKIYLFYKSPPKEKEYNNYYYLFCQEIDIKKGKLYKKPKLITGLPQRFSKGVSKELQHLYFPNPPSISMFNYPYVKISPSQDFSKLLISNAASHGIVLNSKMEKILSYDTPQNLIPIAEIIDNQGNYHAIAKAYEIGDEFNYTIGSHLNFSDYKLVYFHSKVIGETMIQEIDILKDYKVTCAALKELKTGKVICIGAYTNNDTSKLEHGIFAFKTSKVDDINKIPFSFQKDFRKDDIISRKKIKTLLNSINIIDTKDDNLIIIGERIVFNKKPIEQISYQDFTILKLDENFNKIWLNRLPKNVTYIANDYGGGAYKYSFHKDNHYLFFLDEKNNSLNDLKQKPTPCRSSKSGNLTAYCIKESGQVNKKILYSNFSNIKSFQTHTIIPISSTKIVFEKYITPNKSALIKLKL